MHSRMKIMAIGQVMLLASCTGLRYSTAERPLFTGSKVEWTEEPAYDARGAKRELERLVRPSPNNSILGLRPTVALHNSLKEPRKKKGLKFTLKYKLGSVPIHLDSVPVKDIDRAMVNRLHNRGYFDAWCEHEVEQEGRRASLRFTVNPGAPTLITAISMGRRGSDGLDAALAAQLSACPIHIGEPYDLARLTVERDRVTDELRDRGWYRLRSEDLVWAADTTVGTKQVSLELRVKPGTGRLKRMMHSLGSVTLHADQDEVLPPKDTVMVDSVMIINYLDSYRPRAIVQGVPVRPGDTYSLLRTNAMQRYLSSYGVFQNVLVAYGEDTAREGVLDARVMLLPMKEFSFFSEANMVSKSNNFAGPGVRVGFVDRNLCRGAEQFSVDLNGRFETQISGADEGTNAYELGIKAELAIPRMLLLPEPKGVRSSAPVTHIAAGFGVYQRIDLYGMRSAAIGLSYTWRRDQRIWHDLQLLEVSYNDLFQTSPEFNDFLEANPAIQRSFEDQFIVGSGYTYTRSTRSGQDQRNWLVYSLGADESGNLLSLAQRAFTGEAGEEGRTLFGQLYSQYVRLRPELRWFHAFKSGSQLVSRILSHAGLSYGNTDVMPYVKQFFSGGTNSLRGFRARSVGPGSYVTEQEGNFLVNQVGDLKLEVNAEYRFTISGIFKGALFADAGNIWLLNEDPSRPGGEFRWDTFASEIAISTGVGLRIDPKVIVIRFDLARPLRRPDRPEGERWVFEQDGTWTRDIILNFAVGYPF